MLMLNGDLSSMGIIGISVRYDGTVLQLSAISYLQHNFCLQLVFPTTSSHCLFSTIIGPSGRPKIIILSVFSLAFSSR